MEVAIVDILTSLGLSSGGGYAIGWGIGKLIKLVIKAVAIATSAFALVLYYMQYQGYISVNWGDLSRDSTEAVQQFIMNNDVINGITTGNENIIDGIAQTLGLPITTGLGMGLSLGLLKAVRG